MGNASANENQPARYDICADDSACDAGEKTTQQSMLEKGIVKEFKYTAHVANEYFFVLR